VVERNDEHFQLLQHGDEVAAPDHDLII